MHRLFVYAGALDYSPGAVRDAVLFLGLGAREIAKPRTTDVRYTNDFQLRHVRAVSPAGVVF